jgi:hypothetical protein
VPPGWRQPSPRLSSVWSSPMPGTRRVPPRSARSRRLAASRPTWEPPPSRRPLRRGHGSRRLPRRPLSRAARPDLPQAGRVAADARRRGLRILPGWATASHHRAPRRQRRPRTPSRTVPPPRHRGRRPVTRRASRTWLGQARTSRGCRMHTGRGAIVRRQRSPRVPRPARQSRSRVTPYQSRALRFHGRLLRCRSRAPALWSRVLGFWNRRLRFRCQAARRVRICAFPRR